MQDEFISTISHELRTPLGFIKGYVTTLLREDVDWNQDTIVPSVMHGAAAIESWVTEYKDAIQLFVTTGDVAGTQTALQQACVDAGVCQ